MGRLTRRTFAGPLLVLAAGAGIGLAPDAAHAATGISATIRVNSTLMIRAGATLDSEVLGSLRDGQRVTALCGVTGPSVRGSIRTTTQWDKLSTGGYVTDAYVAAARSIPRCTTPQAQKVQSKPAVKTTTAYKVGTVRSTDGKVNIRTGPSPASPVKRSVATGTKVQEICGVVGTLVKGTVRTTTQWNRLSDGTYISHAYVVTPTLHLCPGAASTPPVSTPALTPAQFIAAVVPGAQAGWREYGVPPSTTIAQAILESGWGRSSLSMTDRNYFGIKCQGTGYGKLATGCHVYNTTECGSTAASCFATSASFRTYATMANSFRDHGNFLKVNSRYKPAFVYTRDANKFIWTVWKAGYATDPNYFTKVTGLMATYNLYQYDTWK
ncbi:sporangiospore maturation cell wall hydrolase GsmA [Actinoplanes sp. NPDC051411]|uniref:sporangiospore maturation cell wall hydrolase GsmA n=1 Tax=Actinoplanes sp. NPDC051411 TaxID=3155522 RepID=UPI0034426565